MNVVQMMFCGWVGMALLVAVLIFPAEWTRMKRWRLGKHGEE